MEGLTEHLCDTLHLSSPSMSTKSFFFYFCGTPLIFQCCHSILPLLVWSRTASPLLLPPIQSSLLYRLLAMLSMVGALQDELHRHICRELKPIFHRGTYDVVLNNCNHFSDRLCMYLLGRRLPEEVLRQPRLWTVTEVPLSASLQTVVLGLFGTGLDIVRAGTTVGVTNPCLEKAPLQIDWIGELPAFLVLHAAPCFDQRTCFLTCQESALFFLGSFSVLLGMTQVVHKTCVMQRGGLKRLIERKSVDHEGAMTGARA